jgi:Tfp pilus assembly protein PilX
MVINNNSNAQLVPEKLSTFPNRHTNQRTNQQKGFVLVVSLVFLVALTAVAAALMQNTTSDMKMTGATNERVVATQAAISAVDEVINNQVNIQPVNQFALGLNAVDNLNNAQLLPADTTTAATATVNVINNNTFDEVPCPRTKIASSIGTCNVFQLQIQRSYGRGDNSTVVVNANIAQQLLTIN